MLRPEQIRLATASNANAVAARVVGVQFYGCDAMVRLALGEVTVASRLPGYRAPRTGDEVRLQVDGLVMAYPRAGSEAASGSAELVSARGLQSPGRVATLQIEENLS